MPQVQNPFDSTDEVLIETEEERNKALERPVNPFTGQSQDSFINPFTARDQKFDTTGLTLAQRARDAGINDKIGFDAPTGVFTSIIDLLSRGQFGAAKLVDGILQTESALDIGSALVGAFKEIISPEERLSFSDIIKVQRAEAKGEPLTRGESIAASVLGLVLDIALDPTTYLTFGTSGAVKITSQSIKKLGPAGKAAAKVFVNAKNLSKFEVALSKEGKKLLGVAIGDIRALGVDIAEVRPMAEEAIGALFVRDVLGLETKSSKAFLNAVDTVADFGGDAKSLFDPGGVKFAGKSVFSSEQLNAFGELTGLRRLHESIKRIPEIQKMSGIKFVGRDRLTGLDGDTLQRLSTFGGRVGQIGMSQAVKIAEKYRSVELLESATAATVQKITGLSAKEVSIAKSFADNLVGKKHEYIQFRKNLLNRSIQLERALYLDTIKVFKELSKDQRELIGKVGSEIRDQTRLAIENPESFADLGIRGEQHRDAAGKFIAKFDAAGSDTVIGPIEGRLIAEDVIERSGLRDDPIAFAAFTQFRDKMQRVAKDEMYAGLLNHLTLNYLPARYEAIRSPKALLDFRRNWLNRVGGSFTPDKARKFADDLAAQDAGFDPIYDAAVLYAVRLNESKEAFQNQELLAGVKSIFGVKSLDNLPKEIARDVHFVGDTFYSAGGIPETKRLLRAYDGFLSVFRKSATVLRPSFAVRQVFSNQLQSFAVLGIKTFGALDPRSMGDSLLMISGKGSSIKHIRTSLGTVVSGANLETELFQQGIIRNVTIEAQGRVTGFRGAKKIANEIDLNNFLLKFSGSREAAEGAGKFITGVARFTDWASHVEDFSRTSLYINARKIGHSPKQAKELVERGLFDYLHGLGEVETKFNRRIIPFYTFNRFAIPLIAKTTLETPGRAAGFYKAGKQFFQIWNKLSSGDTLNDTERRVVPGYLLEQPTAFNRLDKQSQKAIFNTFNNFSFLDVMGFLESQENGDIDIKGMLTKASMAQLTPFLKLPLEFLAGKNFFTGGKLPDSITNAPKRKGKLDADNFLILLSGAIGAAVGSGTKFGGLPGAAIGGAAGALLGEIPNEPIQGFVKKILGWEEGIDPETGERQVFVNAYTLNIATGVFPIVNEVFRASDDDRTPIEKVTTGILGIGVSKVNLVTEKRRRIQALLRERNRLVSEVTRAAKEDRTDAYRVRLEEMQDFTLQLEQEFRLIDSPVRGKQP